MIKKYRTNYSRTAIEEVTCLRETKSMVVLMPISENSKERKERKNSEYSSYHDTWEEARSACVSWHEGKTAAAKRAYENASTVLSSVKALKNQGGE